MSTNSNDMEVKIRYLEMIQSVINRMASNSFLLKGWTVTIVVGLFVFANKADNMDPKYIFLALIPAIFFWILDGYFLHQEKLYRELYKYATNISSDEVDFSMNAARFGGEIDSWRKVTLSTTLKLFYIPIICVIGIGIVISFCF